LADEIYLIHEDGRVMAHHANAQPKGDIDLVGGMLAALVEFAKESLGLPMIPRSLDFGTKQLLIESQNRILLIAMANREATKALRPRLRKSLKSICSRLSPVQDHWDGDRNLVDPIRSTLESLVA